MLTLGALPLVLLLIGLLASFAHSDSARLAFRWFRWIIAVEIIVLVVAAVIGLVYENVSSSRARRQYPAPGKLIDMGGYRLHLDCAGEGSPTVVLIYGMSGSYLDWYFVQPQIARFTRVCSYDRPGYGWSDLNSRPRLPGTTADELHTLLEKAGEKPPFILVGHSLGGFDALAYAHRFPQQVAAAVLLDSAHPESTLPFTLRDRIELRFFQLVAPFGLPRWRRWCLQGPPEIAARKSSFNCESRVYKANYELGAAYSEAAKQMRGRTPVETPLVVISRDPNRSGVTNRSAEQRWAQLQQDLTKFSTHATRVIATGSGHGIPLDQPDVVVDQVREIVDSLRANPSLR